MTAVQICLDTSGRAVALHHDSTVKRQVAVQGDAAYSSQWIDVPTDGIEGRILQLAVRFPDGTLIALAQGGQLYEQHTLHHDPQGFYRWRPVPE